MADVMKALILAFMLFAIPAAAQDVKPDDQLYSIMTVAPPPPSNVVFYNNTRPIVTIRANGHVELGEGITLDEASKVFWDQIQRMGTAMACGEQGK